MESLQEVSTVISPSGRVVRSEFSDLLLEIFRLYPEAEHFDPCPCGLTLAVIQPDNVRPWHFPVPDRNLRDRTRERITRLGLPFTNCQDDDAVLVIAEIA